MRSRALEQPLPVSQSAEGQVAATLHEPCAEQSTSHAQACGHDTPPSHESVPQVALQLPVPHVIGPVHDWPPLQLTTQESVAGQAIAPSQLS